MPPTSSFAINVPDSLLARVRAGERGAFEQLYRRFERPVFNLALRMLGSQGVSLDDVELINVNFALTSSLLGGQVDATIGGFRNFR